jgi:hypothetical protein
MSNNIVFEKRTFYEIMWKNIAKPGRPQMTTWRMRIACWIPKATNTNSEYAILIAFFMQQWLHERASMLRFTYIACVICVVLVKLRLWETAAFNRSTIHVLAK